MAVLRPIANALGHWTFWCPGCEEDHQINDSWQFNGNLDEPTFSPSYLTWLDPNPNASIEPQFKKFRDGFRCHSFIINGKIIYQEDCTHALAGQTIKMIEGEQ